MSPLLARRNSLCLFCAFAPRPLSRPQRRLPRLQLAHRSTGSHGPKDLSYRLLTSKKANDAFQMVQTVRLRLGKLKAEFTKPEFLESLQLSPREFDPEWLAFERSIETWLRQASPELLNLAREDARGKVTLDKRLRYLFYAQTYGARFTTAEMDNQTQVADLRYPAEWYPATREIPRTVHLHVGPTNSGKTYHALKRLEEAESGIYLGPLRLLAHEVYTRLNAKGKSCALVTGEEQRVPKGAKATMFSCTVEMAPLNTDFDVAVIDEIQMISHRDRGWAWTQAFLGLKAKELHLCGEARTVPLMRELCALVGDKVHVHEYERLTPLRVQPRSLGGKLASLEKGDCIVAFTVIGIHALRREIEKKTGKQCAIVYGSLPPETRAQQARLFNDPDNDYDYLVASDAIGMGLNLAIKRVIFESTMKSNGLSFAPLQISEIKQIAGRAGRYKTAHQAVTSDAQVTTASDSAPHLEDQSIKPKKEEPQTVGWVTTLDQIDHAYLEQGMKREPEPIVSAGLFPPSLIVERFANYFPPGTPFSYIMLRLHEISEIHPRFHLCALKDQLAIADNIHTIKNLSIQDRIMICAAPLSMRAQAERDFLRSLAQCIADNKDGHLLELKHLPLDVMNKPREAGRAYLYKLEQLHKMLVCYLWLSYRFPNVFTTRALGNYTKKLVEDQIEMTLTDFSFIRKTRTDLLKKRDHARKAIKAYDVDATAEQTRVQEVSAPPRLPAGPKDIVNDQQAYAERSPVTNDVGEYPDDIPLSEEEGRLSDGRRKRHNTGIYDEVSTLLQGDASKPTQSSRSSA